MRKNVRGFPWNRDATFQGLERVSEIGYTRSSHAIEEIPVCIGRSILSQQSRTTFILRKRSRHQSRGFDARIQAIHGSHVYLASLPLSLAAWWAVRSRYRGPRRTTVLLSPHSLGDSTRSRSTRVSGLTFELQHLSFRGRANTSSNVTLRPQCAGFSRSARFPRDVRNAKVIDSTQSPPLSSLTGDLVDRTRGTKCCSLVTFKLLFTLGKCTKKKKKNKERTWGE